MDVDLTNSLPDFVILKVDGLDIEVELHDENLPLFVLLVRILAMGFLLVSW